MNNDSELVKAALDGQKEGFADLIRRYERPVRAVVMNIIGDNHTTEDVVQDTFVAAYLNLSCLRNRDSFGLWLMKIAHRQAIGCVSNRPKEISLTDNAAEAIEDSWKPLDEEDRNLLKAVLSLPDSEKQVVMLRYFAGHSVNEVTEALDSKTGTVTKQLSRAYKRLRKILKESEL